MKTTKMNINMTFYQTSKTLLVSGMVLLGLHTHAKENVGVNPPNGGNGQKLIAAKIAAGCSNPTASTDLDVNNVRARILGASDMWWDLANAKYEIPKNTGKTSIFAGALWIGGIDQGGNVKVAGQTYRQTGNDYWTGPLDTINITVSTAVCNAYDKHFVTTKEDIVKYLADKNSVSSSVTSAIKNWPGNGDLGLGQGTYLAPFFDANADGVYDPDNGDYPGYNLTGEFSQLVPGYDKPVCNDYLFGDKNLWWVFNDVGNIHTESGSDPIGLEVRAQAFGFNTNDEINNMTFYKYQVINRGFTTLNSTYFGQWVDPDLGNAVDDFVGCDVTRGLGYVYNGDEDDDGATGYGLNPPALGVDFFQGPLADIGDGVDNDKDGCLDCTFLDSLGLTVAVPDNILQEQIIMSKFVYYNNFNNTPDGNPNGFTDFYNYLSGIWLDGVPLTYGGNGRDAANPPCNYMFPDDTDSALFASNGAWTEAIAGNTPEDRRFLQSAGTFTLLPGAVNFVTTGVVWSKPNAGGVAAGISLMKSADDKAQALFNNCFKLLDGPDAPTIVIRELKNELIFSLVNTDTSAIEGYDQIDPTIVGVADSLKNYKFQGYKIYQLQDYSVTVADIDNPDKARLVQQYDIRDGVTQLVNYDFDQNLGANVPSEKVNGLDLGISHSFSLKSDAFASGSSKLVNHKSYYFMAVSYAYNEYKKFNPNDPNALDGQKKPYLQGRNNIKVYSAIPHSTTPELGGTYLNSDYGDGPLIQRIDGQGNGGVELDLTPETEAEILSSPANRSFHPIYQGGRGPIDVKVYDPVLVTNGDFVTKFDGVLGTSVWQMQDLNTSLYAQADKSIGTTYEQLIPAWGLSANIHTALEPGEAGALNNGFIAANLTFADNSNQWLSGIPDVDGGTPQNWIRSGTAAVAPKDFVGLDDGQVYENVLGGTWAPFKLTTSEAGGPKPVLSGLETLSKFSNVASIDVVLTSDKSKWSRAAVIELDEIGAGIGQAKKCDLRKSPSIDKNGIANFGAPDNNDFANSMSWFPGYAINQETGERLNIAFGENSALQEQNGQDMIWNPTGSIADNALNAVFGGFHYIYVFGHNNDSPNDVPLYDGCKYIYTKLDSGAITNSAVFRRNVWKDAIWVNLPLTVPSKVKPKAGEMFVPPVDVRIRLRVSKNYRTYIPKTIQANQLLPNTDYYVVDGPVVYKGTTYQIQSTFKTDATNLFYTSSALGNVVTPLPENNFIPMYRFKTDNLVPSSNNATAAAEALTQINVVPNPYYAISGYEGTTGLIGQVDNRIRITNLPSNAKVSIFTTNGSLIRQFKRAEASDNTKGGIGLENSSTYLDWDLRNQKGITIGSGIYLIHIEVPGVGERVIKWFGVLRPIDLDTF